MANSKSIIFETQDIELAKLCKALRHPARIAIINSLLKKKKANCGEIVSDLPLSQSTISWHLKELKNDKIINSENVGTQVFYSINAEQWVRSRFVFTDLFKAIP